MRKTALNSIHRRLGAKMVNFGGWDMPVEYSGISPSISRPHSAGLFDVSHMGEIEVRGPDALKLVQCVTHQRGHIEVGQAQYSGLMTTGGTLWTTCWCTKSDAHYFLCVNAANQDKDFRAHRAQQIRRRRGKCRRALSQLAIQGPLQRRSAEAHCRAAGRDPLLPFHVGELSGVPA